MRVWGELKGDYVEVIKDLGNERVKGEEDPHLINCLAKGHVAVRRKVRSLIPSGLGSQMPQPIFMGDESQFLSRKPIYLVLTNILGVKVRGRSSIV